MNQTWNNSEKFNREASQWDEDPRRRQLAMAVAEAIIAKTNPVKTMHALEVGCGTGLVTLEIAPLVKKVIAIDTSMEMLKILHEKISTFRIENIEATSAYPSLLSTFMEHKTLFDLVYSSMTLHHINDTFGFLNQISNLLVPGGVIAIVDLDVEDGSFHEDQKEKVHYGFDRAELSAMMQAADLKETSFETIFTFNKKNKQEKNTAYTIFLATATKN
ncbi:MAG: class I SAM-dependent methyltransferase [Chlorobiaceae bacterium]